MGSAQIEFLKEQTALLVAFRDEQRARLTEHQLGEIAEALWWLRTTTRFALGKPVKDTLGRLPVTEVALTQRMTAVSEGVAGQIRIYEEFLRELPA